MLRSTIRRAGRAVAYLLPLVLALSACSEKDPCDDGQSLRDGYCYAVDAGLPAADTATAEAGTAFGQTCAASGECPAPTTYCAIQPGQSSGFCTTFGCDQDATICPATWGCMDLTPYGLAAHMCTPSQ
jgi:hypothetical protein